MCELALLWEWGPLFDWRDKLNKLGLGRTEVPGPDQYALDIARRLRMGQAKQALELLKQAHTAYPERMDFLERFWDQAVRVGQPHQASAAAELLILRLIEKDDLERAFFQWQTASKHLNGAVLSLKQTLSFAMQLKRFDRGRAAKTVLKHVVDHLDSNMKITQVYELLQVTAHVDEQCSLKSLDFFLKHKSLSDTDRGALTAMREALIQKNPHLLETLNWVSETIEIAKPIEQVHVDDPFAPSRVQKLHVTRCQIHQIEDKGVYVQVGSQSKWIAHEHIRGVACGCVVDMSGETRYVLDLFAEDPFDDHEQHQVLRFFEIANGFQNLADEKDLSAAEAVLAVALEFVERGNARLIPEDFGVLDIPEIPMARS